MCPIVVTRSNDRHCDINQGCNLKFCKCKTSLIIQHENIDYMTANLTTRPAVFLQLTWKLLQYECLFASLGCQWLTLQRWHAYKWMMHQLLSCSHKIYSRPAGERPNEKTQVKINCREGNSTVMAYTALVKASGLGQIHTSLIQSVREPPSPAQPFPCQPHMGQPPIYGGASSRGSCRGVFNLLSSSDMVGHMP